MSKADRLSREMPDVFGDVQADTSETFEMGGRSGAVLAKALPIMSIMADPTQPRRVVPSGVRGPWRGLPRGVGNVLNYWLRSAVEAGRKEQGWVIADWAWEDMLDPQPQGEVREFENSVWNSLVDLCSLARDIRSQGLTNPITVVGLGDSEFSASGCKYRIDTGERRWLAYHLLLAYTGDAKWQKIPARFVEKSVWRQASENAQRVDLNAIAKARQFALLLMDLLGDEFEFLDFDEVIGTEACDRAFYAQVSDGNVHRIPYGAVEKILTAMGEKSRRRVYEIRSLLRLDDDIWMQADDENWTLGAAMDFLRPETEVKESVPEVPESEPERALETPISANSHHFAGDERVIEPDWRNVTRRTQNELDRATIERILLEKGVPAEQIEDWTVMDFENKDLRVVKIIDPDDPKDDGTLVYWEDQFKRPADRIASQGGQPQAQTGGEDLPEVRETQETTQETQETEYEKSDSVILDVELDFILEALPLLRHKSVDDIRNLPDAVKFGRCSAGILMLVAGVDVVMACLSSMPNREAEGIMRDCANEFRHVQYRVNKLCDALLEEEDDVNV